MSEMTKKKVIERNQSQKVASESGKEEDWKSFKSKRNIVSNVLKKEKEIWQREKLKDNSENSSSTWKNVKTCQK